MRNPVWSAGPVMVDADDIVGVVHHRRRIHALVESKHGNRSNGSVGHVDAQKRGRRSVASDADECRAVGTNPRQMLVASTCVHCCVPLPTSSFVTPDALATTIAARIEGHDFDPWQPLAGLTGVAGIVDGAIRYLKISLFFA
jgi:hypothetical protein